MTREDNRPDAATPRHGRKDEPSRHNANQVPRDVASPSPEDAPRILHELHGRRIELEMQNEALRKARSELETSLARYADLYDRAPVGYVVVGGRGLILEANLAAAALLGETPGALIEQPIARFILKGDQDRFSAYLTALTETETVEAWELRMVKKDGAAVWVRLDAIATRDESGEAVCRIVLSEITDQKRTEEELSESKERYKTIVSSMSDLIFVIDEEDRFVDGYCRSSDALMLPPEAFLGKTVAEVMPPHVNQLYRACASRARQSGENRRYEYSLSIRGETRWFIASLDLHTDGRKLVAGIREITEQKRAEEALRASEGKLNAMLSSLPDHVSVMDKDLNIVWANEIAKQRFGDNIVGKKCHEVYHGRRSPCEPYPCITLKAFEDGKTHTHETQVVDKEGETRVFLCTANVALRDERGNATGVLEISRDITQRKRAEEAMERARDELERRVKERTADLSAANAQLRHERRVLEHMLRASDHERQLIAYDIHDGLAQELTGAIMQFELYERQKDVRPRDAEKVFEGGVALLRQAHGEARRLISGVRPPILDESGVVAAIAHLVYDSAVACGPKIIFRSRVTFSRLDPVAENVVYRVVQEGLSNARKHSQSDQVVVSLVQRRDHLRLEVRDWGVGFDPRTVRENRFGLAGIRERARLLGGKSKIRSKPGEGTAVVVELPMGKTRKEKS